MNYTGLLSSLTSRVMVHRKHYVLDTLLALGSTLFLTGLIYLLHLYPFIPDTLLLYILVILALASLRGLYVALFASCLAFVSFDFFFVPPLYSFVVTKFEDILALVVFLSTALITGQLASALRRRAQDANRREYETRTLYNLVRATNREHDVEHQLHIFVRALVAVFAPWGIRDCILFLPDASGTCIPQASVLQPLAQVKLNPHETAILAQVVIDGHTTEGMADTTVDKLAKESMIHPPSLTRQRIQSRWYVRFIPLKTEQKVVGILRLLIEEKQGRGTRENHLGKDMATPQAIFFSTFLEQGVTVIEHGRLLRESVSLKALQQTDALRSALLSSVSHDLRTPLTAIKTAGSSLLQKDIRHDEEAVFSCATVISQESDRLNRLVGNLLDMSRIEGGALRPRKVWYPLDELIRDVLSRMHPLLKGRAIRLHFPEPLPPVELDYLHIDQVLTNLLENVVYYTPPDSPLEISIQTATAHIMVRIADRGPGVPSAEREHIFDKFYRVLIPLSPTQHTRGSGLGLAVCRGLIEAHGGHIWMEPREGGGATFCFTLPQKKMEEESNE